MKSFSLLSGLVLEVNQAQKEAFDLKGRARLFFSPVLAYACIFFFQDWIHYCLLNIALILEGKEPRIRLMVSQSTEGGPDGVPIFHPQSPLPHPDYSLAQIGSSSPGSDMERKKKPSIAARCARPHCCPGQAISPPEPAKDYSALVPRCLEIKNFEPFQGLVGHCLILTALVLAQWRYRIELDAYPNQDDLMLELNSLAMNLDAFFNNTDNCIFLSPETCIQASHVADQALAFCSSMEARSGGIMTPPFSQWMIGQLLSSSPTKPLEF